VRSLTLARWRQIDKAVAAVRPFHCSGPIGKLKSFAAVWPVAKSDVFILQTCYTSVGYLFIRAVRINVCLRIVVLRICLIVPRLSCRKPKTTFLRHILYSNNCLNITNSGSLLLYTNGFYSFFSTIIIIH